MTTREDFERWLADTVMVSSDPETIAEWTWQACAAHYEAELLKRDALIAEKDKALQAVKDLISESYGVAGLHKNGDVATWNELQTGGQFEEWLSPFDAALSLTHDSVRLVEEAKVDKLVNSVCLDSSGCEKRWDYLPVGTKLYTIVKGEAGD